MRTMPVLGVQIKQLFGVNSRTKRRLFPRGALELACHRPRPRQNILHQSLPGRYPPALVRQCSSVVEQRFRKPSVAGSIPAIGSSPQDPFRLRLGSIQGTDFQQKFQLIAPQATFLLLHAVACRCRPKSHRPHPQSQTGGNPGRALLACPHDIPLLLSQLVQIIADAPEIK